MPKMSAPYRTMSISCLCLLLSASLLSIHQATSFDLNFEDMMIEECREKIGNDRKGALKCFFNYGQKSIMAR